ncbi:putative cytokinetic ring protein SteA [Shouchella shacheensis]|uniref:putative cytokinetic ring protein SteA n=1 Tax=Shouchella shacheensis TaxID=1649580 RepID=UPI00074012B3|nr:putative cytokinetic ring protein SteA [Shouchella shacheensis]
MEPEIGGTLHGGTRTKTLIPHLPEGAIVLLDHRDLDDLSCTAFIRRNVRAVVNRSLSLSGTYRHHQVERLLTSGIAVYDIESVRRQELLRSGAVVVIRGERLFTQDGLLVAELCPYNEALIAKRLAQADECYPLQLEQFMRNSLSHAEKDCPTFITEKELPEAFAACKGRHVLLVARGPTFEKDVGALRKKIRQLKAYVVAIDGAADTLLAYRMKPDVIAGDMDSVSDEALFCGAEVVCHQGEKGEVPARKRMNALGLTYEYMQHVGTSEDMALSGCYQAGAHHLYTVGYRSGMNEFLEKDRKGMGSSLLVGMKTGDKVTDLKGIHKLITRPHPLVTLWKKALAKWGKRRFGKGGEVRYEPSIGRYTRT